MAPRQPRRSPGKPCAPPGFSVSLLSRFQPGRSDASFQNTGPCRSPRYRHSRGAHASRPGLAGRLVRPFDAAAAGPASAPPPVRAGRRGAGGHPEQSAHTGRRPGCTGCDTRGPRRRAGCPDQNRTGPGGGAGHDTVAAGQAGARGAGACRGARGRAQQPRAGGSGIAGRQGRAHADSRAFGGGSRGPGCEASHAYGVHRRGNADPTISAPFCGG